MISTSIFCDVVCSGVNDYCFRLEGDNIPVKTHKHLRTCLPADSTADIIVFCEKFRMCTDPTFGYGVTHKYHAFFFFCGSRKFLICFFIFPDVCFFV